MKYLIVLALVFAGCEEKLNVDETKKLVGNWWEHYGYVQDGDYISEVLTDTSDYKVIWVFTDSTWYLFAGTAGVSLHKSDTSEIEILEDQVSVISEKYSMLSWRYTVENDTLFLDQIFSRPDRINFVKYNRISDDSLSTWLAKF